MNEKHGTYKLRPRHDLYSHGADSVRYLALAVKIHVDTNSGIGDKEAEALYNKHNPVFER